MKQTSRTRRRLLAITALALVAGACGGGDDADDGATATTAAGATATSAAVDDTATSTPGTTPPEAPTGPVEVGFMVTRASNAASFGGELPEQVDQVDIYQALVDSQNADGGLGGRQIEPVFQETDSATENFEAAVAAACATFTEDHHVEAVVGRIADLFDSLETCLNDEQIPHVAAAPEGRDEQFLAQYPYLFNTASLSLEQRTRLKVDYGISSGILTPESKIGVVYAGCPVTERSWNDDALPYMESQGLTVASVFATGCPAGASDAVAEVGKIPNLILQFRSAGVDTLYFHADELAALFIIANVAESQDWHPTYYVSTLANTAVVGTQIPAPQAANVFGLGWSPASDVPESEWPPLNTAAEACLERLSGEGIVPVTPLDQINALLTCDTFTLLADAVEISGGLVDGPSVAAAIEAMGTSHASAYTYDGTSNYAAGRHSGVANAYPFGFDETCTCFRYDGDAVPVPE